MGKHEAPVGATDEWYTPRRIFDALGVRFDMDVAHPGLDKWPAWAAGRVLTADALDQDWSGFVWMNPPFGGRNAVAPWLDKFFAHGNGVALTCDRTSAAWWIGAAARADAHLVIGKPNPRKGDPNKVCFHRPDGSLGKGPGTGTTLFAAGARGVRALVNAQSAGLGLVFQRITEPADAKGTLGHTHVSKRGPHD